MDLGTSVVCSTSVVMAGMATIRYINNKTNNRNRNENYIGNGMLKILKAKLSDAFMKREECPPQIILKSLEDGAKNFEEINKTLREQAKLLARIDTKMEFWEKFEIKK